MIPSHLIELGQQALAAVTSNVASGAPVVRRQLLASEFYEALKRELRATSGLGVIDRAVVVAAANHCRHAATASISPGVRIPEQAAHDSGMMPPTHSEIIPPTVPR